MYKKMNLKGPFEGISDHQIEMFKKQMMHRQRIEEEIELLRGDMEELENKQTRLKISAE